ncbi:hypothetical protein MG290_08245 [Flavobacterium sp. CBA20B-1]|uniref:hypothetical protein n=1 Tax=unclassified Flavobacterium TaxID=196869 RepID=UPI002223FC15|nr:MULTISPECIES: hypothetical protein [unclassified Flavobacterium]WCM40952.1 hypothetical protein MG290_08245 [Flavobacterium sp. CBA20B-1]
MQNEYKALADSYKNALFSFTDYKVGGIGGSKLPISEYIIEVTYKNMTIKMRNELGNYNLGTVDLILSNCNFHSFEITSRNHFMSLFSRKKEMLKISCNNLSFRNTLQETVINCGLEKIAKQNAFEPHIVSSYKDGKWKVASKYHLEFEDKIGAANALIDFYKLLIDFV